MKRGTRSAKCGAARWITLLGVLALLSGCAARKQFTGSRPFDFHRDTFVYANELVWNYHFDDTGKWVHEKREPEPDYTHHCFVVARSARQFFQHATFAPALPVADEAAYRKLIRRVVAVDPSRALPPSRRVVIPGYANLREFSAGQEKLLKEECGGAWRSYFQRGNWRMVFPFSRAHQARTVEALLGALREHRPPVVHVVRFPALTINHALLLFDASQTDSEIRFSAYDPNHPDAPAVLKFDRASRTFQFQGNDYFRGGAVDVYEIYWQAMF